MGVVLHPGGATRIGEYELLRRIGRGGMATVYLARDRYGRHVAIKVLHSELAWDDELRRRFRSEVNRLQQVPRSSTAAILDADFEHDPPYLVVEYVDGPSLAQVIRESGPLGPAALRNVAIGVTSALAAIHSAGVIHRDLKPENVLLGAAGVKVIDFGIARPMEATSLHTRIDQVVGTVSYMAPERFGDDAAELLSPATDVFAWGVLVAYAANGFTPFAGDSAPATAVRIITQPPDLGDLSGPIRGLVERALDKDPRRRPTAADLLKGLLGRGNAASLAPAARRRRRRSSPLVVAGVVVAAALAATGTVAALTGDGLDGRAGERAGGQAPAAANGLGGSAPAPKAGRTTAAAARVQKPVTASAMVELVARLFPGLKISRTATDTTNGRHFVQMLLDDGDGPGWLGVEVLRDDDPDLPERGAAPVTEVKRFKQTCLQDVVVSARWSDGTTVRAKLSTCLPGTGGSNATAPWALTLDQAERLVADPRWGVVMDVEIIEAGARNFPDILTYQTN